MISDNLRTLLHSYLCNTVEKKHWRTLKVKGAKIKTSYALVHYSYKAQLDGKIELHSSSKVVNVWDVLAFMHSLQGEQTNQLPEDFQE